MSEHGHPETAAKAPATGLGKVANSIEAFIKPIYTWIGYFGAAVMAALVLAMVYSVIARRFGHPLKGSSDLIELSLLLVTATVLGIEHMGHEKMTVDVIFKKLPKRVQSIISPIVYLLGIVVLVVATWQLIKWGIKVQGRHEQTSTAGLGIPKYPFVYLISFGIFTLIPIYVARFLGAVDKAVKL